MLWNRKDSYEYGGVHGGWGGGVLRYWEFSTPHKWDDTGTLIAFPWGEQLAENFATTN